MLRVKRFIMAGLVGAAIAMSTVGGALAFHPGVNNNPDHELPQGPHITACQNQGGAQNPNGEGVFNAIAVGGMVHCEEDGALD